MIEENGLPQGWYVVTAHYPHGDATGTLVEKGEARVLLLVSNQPEKQSDETLETDEGPIPVVVLAEASAGDLEKVLKPYDPDPRAHSADSSNE